MCILHKIALFDYHNDTKYQIQIAFCHKKRYIYIMYYEAQVNAPQFSDYFGMDLISDWFRM